jgi:sterol desaturase/sphingolipid hydroxylase (fatty acid hydroxylase superfamily)
VAKVERSVAISGRVVQILRGALVRLQQAFTSEMPAWAFFLDFVIYPPLILLCLYHALAGGGFVQATLALLAVLAGGVLWSLAEYGIHRFAFHHAPVLRPIHMAHHEAPRDLHGTPTLFTVIVFYLLVYLPLSGFLPRWGAMAGTAGVMLGYLAYVLVHYVVHHRGSGGVPALRRLIRLHAVHHHDTEHNFGVTTDLWDRVFGTLTRR